MGVSELRGPYWPLSSDTPGAGAEYAAVSKRTSEDHVTEQLWGGETTKAVDNFPVSGERVPVPVVRWLAQELLEPLLDAPAAIAAE